MSQKYVPPRELAKLLSYERETGKLYWRERGVEFFEDATHSAERIAARWNTRFAGAEAFTSTHNKGYKIGRILDRMYRAHRVVWAMHHGEWPREQIDHINGDPADNRIENLREVSNSENCRNKKRSRANKSGVTGVHWYKESGKWAAKIRRSGKNQHLGYFDRIEDAAKARKDAEVKYGYHENHGRKPSEATK